MQLEMVLSCVFCPYRCETRLNLIKHSFAVHSTEPTFHLECGIKGCLYYFKVGSTFSSFKTHASRKHSNWQRYVNTPAAVGVPMVITPPLSTSADLPVDNSEVSLECTLNDLPDPDLTVSTDPEMTNLRPLTSCSEEQRAAALFLLTFKEKHQLSQTAIDFAVASTQTIIESVCKSAITSVEWEASSSADDIIAKLNDPFSSLQTKYQQDKFYRDEFGLVVSAWTHLCMSGD